MTIVKICGLRTIEHALAALEAGSDLLGFIFAPARRQVSPAEVAAISSAVRAAPGGDRVGLVGVFVNEAPDRIAATAAECGLDAIQLSGDEDARVLRELPGYTIFKAVRLAGAEAEQSWLDRAGPRLLVDGNVPGGNGGAGGVADWAPAAEVARRRRMVRAGGLAPAKVAAASGQVRPWGVDVSSGVETDGVKDNAKIRAFVAAVRVADRERLEIRD